MFSFEFAAPFPLPLQEIGLYWSVSRITSHCLSPSLERMKLLRLPSNIWKNKSYTSSDHLLALVRWLYQTMLLVLPQAHWLTTWKRWKSTGCRCVEWTRRAHGSHSRESYLEDSAVFRREVGQCSIKICLRIQGKASLKWILAF